MKYVYMVKYKGTYYPAGAEVPVEVTKTSEELEAERLEHERLEAERLEAERLEAERLETERIEAEKLLAEKAAKEAQIKAVKAMNRGELDAFAPTVGITVEADDTAVTLKEKILAAIG